MPKTIHIIGGGIAGLSAGIYAQYNGFQSTIFELGPKAGGVCTSWEREGYTVNGSVHWLVGSAPGTDLYDMWRQLGVIEGSSFHNHSSFIEYKDIEGQDVHFYLDLDRLKAHFQEISPADYGPIDELIEAIKTIAHSDFPMDRSFELLGVWDWTKIALGNFAFLMAMGKYNQITVREFAERFQSKVLQKAFHSFWLPDMSMTFFLMQYAYAYKGTAGYPIGGSGKLVEKMVMRYEALGGHIQYESRVKGLLIEDDRAVGVRLEDGSAHYADYTIASCDGHTVLFEMLEGQYIDDKTKAAYETLQTFPSLVYFSAGIAREVTEVPPSIVGLNIPLKPAIQIGDYTHGRASFQFYTFDPTVAPPGKTLVTAMLDTDYASWRALHDQGEAAYWAERQRISQALLEALDQQVGNIKEHIDFVDLATPITYKNWTGNHNGSYEGWLPTPEASKARLATHFKGLANFYMAGHWVAPGGGMPPAAYTGRNAVQLICKQEKQYFATHPG